MDPQTREELRAADALGRGPGGPPATRPIRGAAVAMPQPAGRADPSFFAAQDLAPDPRWFDDLRPVPAPRSEVISAAAEQAWTENPGIAGFRFLRRRARDAAATESPEDAELGLPPAPYRMLTPEEANQRYGIQGHLSFQQPIAEPNARELRDLKRAEIVRNDTLARARGGAAEWTGRIAASLAASVVDPLNIASAFVPVVGQARAAAWLGQATTRLGRVGVAAGIGVAEGAVGAAILEPLNHIFARDEQRDYGMVESLLNVAFGAVLGAGLHAGGRAVADRLQGWTPPTFGTPAAEAHEAMVRSAVAAVAQGEPVRASHVGRLYGDDLRSQLLSSTARVGYGPDGLPFVRADEPAVTPAQIAAVGEVDPAGRAALESDVARRAGIMAPVLDRDGQPIIALSAEEERKIAARLARDGEREVGFVRLDDEPGAYAVSLVDGAEVYRTRDGAPRVYPSISRAKDAAKQIEGDGWFPVEVPGEEGVVLMRAPGPTGARLLANRRLLDVGPAFLRPDLTAPPMSSDQARAMLAEVARDVVRAEARAGSAAADAAWARVAGDVSRADAAPGGAAPAVPPELQAEVQNLDALLAEQVRAGRLPETALAEVKAADEAMRLAQERAKGFEAAAACLIGNGAM